MYELSQGSKVHEYDLGYHHKTQYGDQWSQPSTQWHVVVHVRKRGGSFGLKMEPSVVDVVGLSVFNLVHYSRKTNRQSLGTAFLREITRGNTTSWYENDQPNGSVAIEITYLAYYLRPSHEPCYKRSFLTFFSIRKAVYYFFNLFWSSAESNFWKSLPYHINYNLLEEVRIPLWGILLTA